MSAGDRRERRASLVNDGAKRRVAGLVIADQHFAGSTPRKLPGKIAAANGLRKQLAGRDVERGKRKARVTAFAPGRAENRGEEVMSTCIEHGLLGERARSDETDHVAPQPGLRSTFPCLCR